MSAGISQTPASVETQILQFARAFRSAARVVGFYPPAHPAVGTSLEHVAAAARSAAAGRPLALTILPDAFLVGASRSRAGRRPSPSWPRFCTATVSGP